jgi:hypothetical protein
MTTPRPEPECVKCGARYGFLACKPRYQAYNENGQPADRLYFSCDSCGYTVWTPSADRVAEDAQIKFWEDRDDLR